MLNGTVDLRQEMVENAEAKPQWDIMPLVSSEVYRSQLLGVVEEALEKHLKKVKHDDSMSIPEAFASPILTAQKHAGQLSSPGRLSPLMMKPSL